MQELENGSELQLTDDEQRAAPEDTRVRERVYAPASERVPKPPAPGDREIIDGPESRVADHEEGDAHATR